MKNLLISLIIACVVSTSFVSTASAEPTPEYADNVVSMVIQVNVRSKHSGKVTSQKKYPFSFKKPISTALKFCATDNGSSRICLYRVEGDKQTYVFDYQYSVDDDAMVVYQTVTKPKTASR